MDEFECRYFWETPPKRKFLVHYNLGKYTIWEWFEQTIELPRKPGFYITDIKYKKD